MFVMLSPFEILDYRWVMGDRASPQTRPEASDDVYPPASGAPQTVTRARDRGRHLCRKGATPVVLLLRARRSRDTDGSTRAYFEWAIDSFSVSACFSNRKASSTAYSASATADLA